MKRSNPMRLHFTLFLVLSIVGIAQLSWWVIFQIQEGDRVTAQQNSIWDQQKSMALLKIQTDELSPAAIAEWLNDNFPDLAFLPEQAKIEVTQKAMDRLDEIAQKRVRMFISEGAFFSLLVLTGVWFFYWALRKRIEQENRTASIIHAASLGMKGPLEALKNDIQSLSDTDSSFSQQKESFRRISSNIKKISDTCEQVSIIQMLGTSKRNIQLEMINISTLTNEAIEKLKGSLPVSGIALDFEIAPDLKAVSNPEHWNKIVQSFFRKSEDCSKMEVLLVRKAFKAELVVNYNYEDKDSFSSAKLKEIGADLDIISELAGAIGVKISIIPGYEKNSITFMAEIPLLDDGN